MAKTYHPDLYPYDDTARSSCERKMRLINEAYEYLKEFAPNKSDGPIEPDPHAEPDLEAKYGADTAEAPWPEPEPFDENTPGLNPYREDLAKLSARKKPSPWSPLRHRMPRLEPDFPGLFQTGSVFGVAILILGSLFFVDLTAFGSYFSFMRIFVCLACAHGAYFAACRAYWDITMACMILALTLNPALPLRMGLEGWEFFNILCAILLVFFWILMLNRESTKALGIRTRD